jgi:hypothetical protein
MPRISIKIAHSFALATLLCFGPNSSFACPATADSDTLHLFNGAPEKFTTFCINKRCLKRGQIYYAETLKEDLPQVVASVPAVLSFLADLSKHKTVAGWCSALRTAAELQRPLFCDKPEVVVGALPRDTPPLSSLVIWGSPTGGYTYFLKAPRRGNCPDVAAFVSWDSVGNQFMVENPTDLVGFFFKRKGCKLVQPPVVTYDPTGWERMGMNAPK